MERKSELTKALLGEKFKELVAKKGFDKLTIKMITDAAGVIRPTFYNYFQDKYEVMEWLLWEDVFKEATRMMDNEEGMESLRYLFQRFDEDKMYYEKVFEVTGQKFIRRDAVSADTGYGEDPGKASSVEASERYATY